MSAKVRRLLVISLVVLISAGVTWAVYALLREEPPPAQTDVNTATEFASPKLVGWSKGVRQWMVEATGMNDAGNSVTLEGIHRGVLYKDGQEYFNFKAKKGTWLKAGDSQGGGDLTLSGDVTVYKGTTQVFKTDQLIWQGHNQLLVAPQAVNFAFEGNSASASRLTFDSATEDVTLSGEVRVTMQDGTRVTVQGELQHNLKTGDFQVKGDQEFEFNT